MKRVLIFRRELLPASETFIQAQAAALTRFRPQFIGFEPASASLPLSPDVILLTRSRGLLSKLRARAYTTTGVAPLFHRKAAGAGASLVHAHFARDGAAALPLAGALGLPLVLTLHGFDVTVRPEFQTSARDRHYLQRRGALWNRAAVFLCVSEFIREKAREAGFPEEKLRVHRIGVDLRQFAFAGGERRQNSVLFVGRLVEKKGAAYLIPAMASVQRAYPDMELVVAGDGPLRGALEQTAQNLGIRCNFLGHQSPAAVSRWLQRASVVCIPSITASDGDSEGLPMVLIEALAVGTPVVASRHAGIPEAVEHEKTGLLTEERDVAGIASSLLRILGDKNLRATLSLSGRRMVEERFNLAQQTAELEDIYESFAD